MSSKITAVSLKRWHFSLCSCPVEDLCRAYVSLSDSITAALQWKLFFPWGGLGKDALSVRTTKAVPLHPERTREALKKRLVNGHKSHWPLPGGAEGTNPSPWWTCQLVWQSLSRSSRWDNLAFKQGSQHSTPNLQSKGKLSEQASVSGVGVRCSSNTFQVLKRLFMH